MSWFCPFRLPLLLIRAEGVPRPLFFGLGSRIRLLDYAFCGVFGRPLKNEAKNGKIFCISTILRQLNKERKPLLVALFLLCALVFLRLFIFVPSVTGQAGVFGGPVQAKESFVSGHDLAMLVANVSIAEASGSRVPIGSDAYNNSGVFSASLIDASEGVFTSQNKGGAVIYRVQKGDNLARIAKQFGISLDSLLSANPGVSSGSLKKGQELSILPVFNASLAVAAEVPVGADPALPSLKGYFIMPTEGFDWGVLHNYNAVDIANACGTPVVAAAEGLVEDYGSALNFNGGYGGFVLLEHPNGTKTRYAHLDKLYTQLGDYVKQGQKIGEMGSTGNVHGPTGCHLHFEVYGAQNPFSK